MFCHENAVTIINYFLSAVCDESFELLILLLLELRYFEIGIHCCFFSLMANCIRISMYVTIALNIWKILFRSFVSKAGEIYEINGFAT